MKCIKGESCLQCGSNYCRFVDELYQLKQTLADIKEIALILAPMTDEYENCYDRDRCFECDFTEDCQYFNIKRIIQKMSEAENEYNTKDIRHINKRNQEYIAECNRMTKK